MYVTSPIAGAAPLVGDVPRRRATPRPIALQRLVGNARTYDAVRRASVQREIPVTAVPEPFVRPAHEDPGTVFALGLVHGLTAGGVETMLQDAGVDVAVALAVRAGFGLSGLATAAVALGLIGAGIALSIEDEFDGFLAARGRPPDRDEAHRLRLRGAGAVFGLTDLADTWPDSGAAPDYQEAKQFGVAMAGIISPATIAGAIKFGVAIGARRAGATLQSLIRRFLPAGAAPGPRARKMTPDAHPPPHQHALPENDTGLPTNPEPANDVRPPGPQPHPILDPDAVAAAMEGTRPRRATIMEADGVVRDLSGQQGELLEVPGHPDKVVKVELPADELGSNAGFDPASGAVMLDMIAAEGIPTVEHAVISWTDDAGVRRTGLVMPRLVGMVWHASLTVVPAGFRVTALTVATLRAIRDTCRLKGIVIPDFQVMGDAVTGAVQLIDPENVLYLRRLNPERAEELGEVFFRRLDRMVALAEQRLGR